MKTQVFVDVFATPQRICFGKHKGASLSVPETSYFQWALQNLAMDGISRSAVLKELERRAGAGNSRPNNYRTAPNIPAGVTPQVLREIVSTGRQHLAKRYHPDAGGDASKMIAVNVAADYLEAQVTALLGVGK